MRLVALTIALFAGTASARAQDSQGLWTHSDHGRGMSPPPEGAPSFISDVRFGYALELRDMPEVGLIHAHGGAVLFAPALGEYFAAEIGVSVAITPTGERVHLLPRPSLGLEVSVNDGPVVLSGALALAYAGYGEHVRHVDDDTVWFHGVALNAGVIVTFAPYDIASATAFGFYADVRYQAAVTERGLEHGPLVSIGIAFLDRSRVDRGSNLTLGDTPAP